MRSRTTMSPFVVATLPDWVDAQDDIEMCAGTRFRLGRWGDR